MAKTEGIGTVKPKLDRLRLQALRVGDALQHRVRGRAHRRQIFGRLYDNHLWGGYESSASPADGSATEAIRRELPALFARYGIGSLLDAPCGNFTWMKHVASRLERYTGVDIVRDLIDRNTRLYGTDRVRFEVADIVSDPLPSADAVLCRDCCGHLPTRLIWAALKNFRASGVRYLLLSNDRDSESYHDIRLGKSRPVNFARPPFSFPPPLSVVNESASGDRQLCLWEIDSLPMAAARSIKG